MTNTSNKMDKAIAAYVAKLEKEYEDLKKKDIQVLGVRDINRQYEILSQLRALLQERLDQGNVSSLPCTIGPPIVEVIRRNSKKESLMEECTCILYFISIFDPYYKKGVARLFKALQDHPDSDAIHKASLAAIRNVVAANRDSLPRIAPSIPLILDSMDRFPDNIDLVSSALEILENVASHPPNKQSFVECGALDQLQTTMSDHLHNASLQGTILRALSNLSFECEPELRTEMVPMLALVLSAMSEHPKSSKVQMYGCTTLQNLSSSTGSPLQKEDGGADEIAVDAFNIILTVMKELPDNKMVQEQGIKTVHKMLQDLPDVMIGDVGMATIIEAMTRYSHVLDVQIEGLSILQLLGSKNTENYELVFSEGGIDVLLAAMITYPDNVRVSTAGCLILKDFTRLSMDFQRAVSAKGGIGVILTAMKRHAHNEDIQDPAFACMRNLCLHQDNRENVKREGGIPICLANMTHLKRNAAIQAYGCDALGRLAPISFEAVLSHHGIEVAVEAMRTHPSHAGVQDRGCFLLMALSDYKPALSYMRDYDGLVDTIQVARIPPKKQAMERRNALVNVIEQKGASWFGR